MNRRDFLMSSTALLVAPTISRGQQSAESGSEDVVFADFESGTYDGWTLEGNCWGKEPASDATFAGKITGFQGKRFLCTLNPDPKLGNAATGKAVSKEFTIEKPFINFLIGGGNHPGEACLNLVVDGTVAQSETGDDSAELRMTEWDVRRFMGKKAHLVVVDTTRNTKRGYLMIDEIVFSDLPGFLRNAQVKESGKIQNILERTRIKYDQPAMGACVVLNGQIYCADAGYRKEGEPDRVTIRDRFRFGSLTKGFVATMFGSLIESGHVRLEMTLKEVFPELKDVMRPEYREVTLAQVLGHQAGFSRYIQPKQVMVNGKLRQLNTYDKDLDYTQQRYEFTKNIEFQKPPSNPIGTYAYADAGYVVAGAIASKLTSRSWEQLIQERVFTPLRMTSSGFNFPEPGEGRDFPWQHIVQNGHRTAIAPVPRNSNGPLLDTTGGLYCTLGEIGRFLLAHLEGENGRNSILRTDTFRLLHRPRPNSDYGLGWNNVHWGERGERRVIEHGGGNPFATSHWWVFPHESFAVCVITTEGGNPDAEGKAIYEVEAQLEANRSY